jgi:hypothetical protein
VAAPAQMTQSGGSGAAGRPLVVPLASGVAGELRGIEPSAIVYDVNKLSSLVRDLTQSLRADAAVVEFGTLWDVEAWGGQLDWSDGGAPSARPGTARIAGDLDTGAGRAPVVLEALRRLKQMIGDRVALAAGVTGPVTLSSLTGGAVSPGQAASLLLPVVRSLCEAGAGIVWVVETAGAPEDDAALAGAAAPLWGTARFFGATAVLHVAGDADAWAPFVARGGPYVTCFEPDRSPALASHFAAGSGEFGLALAPGATPADEARALAADARCRIVTNTRELSGQVRAGDLPAVVTTLRSLASSDKGTS